MDASIAKADGGSRSFTSLYWLTDTGFQRRDFKRTEKPTREQLAKLFDEEGVVAALKPVQPVGPAKYGKLASRKRQKTKTARRSKPPRAATPKSKSSAAKTPKKPKVARRVRKNGVAKNSGSKSHK